MNHITGFFTKYAHIAKAGAEQKSLARKAFLDAHLTIAEDALIIKGATIRVFCTTALATKIKKHEGAILASLKKNKVSVSRVIPVIVA